MREIKRKIRRLSFDELRVRCRQKFAAVAERHGWTSQARLPSDQDAMKLLDPAAWGRPEPWSAEELLTHFRSRTQPKFFLGFADREQSTRELEARWPNSTQDIIEEADAVIDGRFQLLGSQALSFGSPVDWHFEPVLGKRIPLVHWSKLDYLDAERAGDKKIVWELNRHQYFTTLGQAYWLTGEEKYAQTFVAHLESWMDQNTPKLGINWASSLEIAFRSISWLWGFYFFRDSPSLNSRTFLRALKFLYLNARHLETYLSTYFSPNTHLTGEALGLFYLGLLLPEFKESARWRETGQRILIEQLPIHVLPDGVYFEQSSYYHRYTTDFYTHFLILARANGVALPAEISVGLNKLLDHLMYITRPDGTSPFFGDDDGGRLVMLDRRSSNDFRAALSTGAVLFNRSDYKFVAHGVAEETLWLMGPAGLRELDQIVESKPARQSVVFENGGYYVMRDDWSLNGNYLLFDCGPHGQDNCGHAHADALSFELAANGRSILVDPGTYTYTGSAELRDWFRSSAAHNTLTVAQRSSSLPAGPFSWKSVARCEPLAWLNKARFDYVAGSHDGFASGPQPTKHDRSILFLKHDYWIIRDRVMTASECDVDVWFHFDSSANPLIEAGASDHAFIADHETGLDVRTFARNGRWRREEGWVSHCYSQKEPARVYAFSARLASGTIISFLMPWKAGVRWQVREIESVGGHAFEIANDNWLDIVMIRTGEQVETARLASDFEWTWVRVSSVPGSSPKEVVLINGKTLQIEGREVLKTTRGAGYVSAHWDNHQFWIDSDESEFETAFSPEPSNPSRTPN